MAVIPGEQQAVRGGGTKPKPPPLQNPWNLNIPGLPSNNGRGGIIGQPAAPAPAAPAASAAPAATPFDFASAALNDPEYTTGQALLARQNTMNLKALKQAWLGRGQQYQDSANAHGALFSGAAVNAQRSNDQGYADQQAQQALDFDKGGSGLYFTVFNRLKDQVGNALNGSV